ncbi:MAG: hypothetical protein ACKOWW_06430 [Flavobacteriales bacterium]
MIRIVLALVLISFTQLAFAQSKPLKRKYRGTYEGEIPAYNAIIGTKEVSVRSQNIELSILKDSIYLTIGKYKYANTYDLNKNGTNIQLRFEREGSGIEEVLLLEPKTRNLTRKGLYPQPDTVLKPKKKSTKG